MEDIKRQYQEGRVNITPMLENLVDKFKNDKSSLDVQQLQLVTEYLITDREIDENYIEELESALDNSVSKDEIKAKINDINNWLDSGRYMHYSMDPYELEAQKRILQELLNKGE